MRNRIVPLLVVVIVGANLRADPIRYDQIPSDVISYIHFDTEQFLNCRAVKSFGVPADLAAKARAKIGGNLKSCTAYFFEEGGAVQTVILVHADAGVRAKAEAYANRAKDKVIIKYDDQEVYYSSEGLLAAIESTMESLHEDPTPHEEPVYKRMPDGTLVPESKDDANRNQSGIFAGHGQLSIGVNSDKNGTKGLDLLMAGPAYRAFVGQDLIIMTTDLRMMSKALDAVHGKKPALAKEDPRGLKSEIPAGAIFMGAGLTANLSGDSPGSSTRPSNTVNASNNGFGLDMFATFKGKAQLARFAVGEDDRADYIDASILMSDGEVAEQLKNLMIGVKALVSLSQAKQAPLVEPLQVRANGKEVGLHWSWPTDKLADLIKLAENDGDGNVSTSVPTSNGGR